MFNLQPTGTVISMRYTRQGSLIILKKTNKQLGFRLTDELKGEMDGMQFSSINRTIVREPTQ